MLTPSRVFRGPAVAGFHMVAPETLKRQGLTSTPVPGIFPSTIARVKSAERSGPDCRAPNFAPAGTWTPEAKATILRYPAPAHGREGAPAYVLRRIMKSPTAQSLLIVNVPVENRPFRFFLFFFSLFPFSAKQARPL